MSGGQAQKKQSFLQGVAVLTAATIIVKLLGFIYKVPLQNILQERGFGYFNTAYDVYNVLLMISTTGLPVAVSRMISQAQALDNYAQIRKIYSVSMKVFSDHRRRRHAHHARVLPPAVGHGHDE